MGLEHKMIDTCSGRPPADAMEIQAQVPLPPNGKSGCGVVDGSTPDIYGQRKPTTSAYERSSYHVSVVDAVCCCTSSHRACPPSAFSPDQAENDAPPLQRNK
jgi:hypothetical protein